MPQQNYNPDVLTCLANLSNDEVFTPPVVVNKMLDLLPVELWRNPDARFLDPVSKSGVFLREMAKRLDKGLEQQMPDRQQRINHILSKQLFGIAITELTALLSRRSAYCSKTANGRYSICDCFDDEKGNVIYDRTEHSWVGGKCRYCGASEAVYSRGDELETHAYQFIHTDKPEDIFKNMKFDVIIGNPPYQLNDGGFGKSAKPLYHLFIQQAKKLNPRYLTMIVPDKWFAGGKGLDSFRGDMLNDSRIKYLVDYTSANEVFPGVDVPGGICYFLWEKDYNGECEISVINKGVTHTSKRALNEFETFVRHGESAEIINRVKAIESTFMNSIVSSRKPFGLATNDRPTAKGDLQLFWNGGIGPYQSSKIAIGKDMIDKWKVVTSKVSFDHGGQPDKDGKRRVLSKIEILPPNMICTETYIVVSHFDHEDSAKNVVSYLKTKFTRFLISQLSFSQDITKERFAFVPMQDFSESWTDEKLYKKYGLTPDEIAFIESMIRPMEITKE